MESNVVKLAHLAQVKFRKNILARVIGQDGLGHCPTIYVEIELPNGKIFKGNGSNQKIAKEAAAKEALEYLINTRNIYE